MLYADPFLTVYCCLLAALLGACMGSFLNCAAWRIVHGESVLRGRSHCDACGHVLTVRDLIPVVSYLAAHGRCRYCGAKLSRRHVMAEAVSALVFVTLLLHYDISLQALEGWCVAGILLACSFADLEGVHHPRPFHSGRRCAIYHHSFLRPPAAPAGAGRCHRRSGGGRGRTASGAGDGEAAGP